MFQCHSDKHRHVRLIELKTKIRCVYRYPNFFVRFPTASRYAVNAFTPRNSSWPLFSIYLYSCKDIGPNTLSTSWKTGKLIVWRCVLSQLNLQGQYWCLHGVLVCILGWSEVGCTTQPTCKYSELWIQEILNQLGIPENPTCPSVRLYQNFIEYVVIITVSFSRTPVRTLLLVLHQRRYRKKRIAEQKDTLVRAPIDNTHEHALSTWIFSAIFSALLFSASLQSKLFIDICISPKHMRTDCIIRYTDMQIDVAHGPLPIHRNHAYRIKWYESKTCRFPYMPVTPDSTKVLRATYRNIRNRSAQGRDYFNRALGVVAVTSNVWVSKSSSLEHS